MVLLYIDLLYQLAFCQSEWTLCRFNSEETENQTSELMRAADWTLIPSGFSCVGNMIYCKVPISDISMKINVNTNIS